MHVGEEFSDRIKDCEGKVQILHYNMKNMKHNLILKNNMGCWLHMQTVCDRK